jgi:hypothetical protein
MIWAGRSALPPIAPHAVVSRAAVEQSERSFAEANDLELRIDQSFVEFERAQPTLAAYLAGEFGALRDETAEALGFFLSVCVHEAFFRAFGDRLDAVDADALAVSRGALALDETLRRENPKEPLESDDVIAMRQPHVMAFVREQLDSVLAPDGDDDVERDVDVDSVNAVYESLMVMILALSSAVRAPQGQAVSRRLLS